MQKRSRNLPFVIGGAILVLFYLLHSIFNILFEEWIKHQLENYLGVTIAEVVERFGAISLPLFFAIAVVWFLYRYLKRDFDSRIQPDKADSLAPKIEICSEAGSPYEVSNIIGERINSTVRIGIKNSGGSSLSNCKVFIEEISPRPALFGGLPILLEGGGFMLRHDDPQKLIDIAGHWNHVQKYRFIAPHGTFAETMNYMDSNIRRTIVIRIEASECQRSALFDIWTEESKTLHLRYVSDVA